MYTTTTAKNNSRLFSERKKKCYAEKKKFMHTHVPRKIFPSAWKDKKIPAFTKSPPVHVRYVKMQQNVKFGWVLPFLFPETIERFLNLK